MKPPSHPYTLIPSYIPSFLLIPLFPNALIRDIMVANPQSAKRDSLIQKLDQRLVPMPDTMKAKILEGINFLSQREILESEIGLRRNLDRKLFYILSRYIIQDTTFLTPLDSLKKLLTIDDHPESKYLLSFILLHQVYLAYFQILAQLNQIGQVVPVNDSSLIEDLQGLAEDDNEFPGAFARNLLIASGLMNYSEPIEFPDTSLPGPSLPIWNKENDEGSFSISNESFIRVFPNPAKDYIIIEFLCSSVKEIGELRIDITDGSGNLIRTIYPSKSYDQIIFRTGNLFSGLYLCELKANKKVLFSEKFILTR